MPEYKARAMKRNRFKRKQTQLGSMLTSEQKIMMGLAKALPQLRGKSREIAASLFEKWNRTGFLTEAQYKLAASFYTAKKARSLPASHYAELEHIHDTEHLH